MPGSIRSQLFEIIIPLITTPLSTLSTPMQGLQRLKMADAENSLAWAVVDSSTEVSFATFGYLGATAGGFFLGNARALECYEALGRRTLAAVGALYAPHDIRSARSHTAKAPSIPCSPAELTARQEQVRATSRQRAVSQHLRRAHVRSRRQSQRARGPCSHPKPPAPTASPSR